MHAAFATVLLFTGSRDSWESFALGVAAGIVVFLLFKFLRRKEDR